MYDVGAMKKNAAFQEVEKVIVTKIGLSALASAGVSIQSCGISSNSSQWFELLESIDA